VFLHFAVPAPLLQAATPFPLETWHGESVVTLVAFTMRRMRFARWERLSEVLLWPFREQLFLNLRTYVRVGGEPGITFLAEWISSWIQAQLGPRLYGLPYRWGRHEFAHDPVRGRWTGRVGERGRVGQVEDRGAGVLRQRAARGRARPHVRHHRVARGLEVRGDRGAELAAGAGDPEGQTSCGHEAS
jgi:hypothetical protein